jgi:hypothetical protein
LLRLHPCGEFDGGSCLIAWTYVLLNKLPWLSVEAVQLIINSYRGTLRHYGGWYWQANTLEPELRVGHPPESQLTLAFADTHFVTCTDAVGWLNLETGEHQKLPVTPLETIGYNLAELFRRNYSRCVREDSASTGCQNPLD